MIESSSPTFYRHIENESKGESWVTEWRSKSYCVRAFGTQTLTITLLKQHLCFDAFILQAGPASEIYGLLFLQIERAENLQKRHTEWGLELAAKIS